jgi:tellurite resistance protein TerC
MGLTPDPVGAQRGWPEGRVNDARSAMLPSRALVELSLSADNVFVIAMLFSYFGIPLKYQHRVLFWGILGALAMRGAMIAVGAQLVSRFAWTLPAFGVVLIATAARMLCMGDQPADPGQKLLVRLMRRLLPLTGAFHGALCRAPRWPGRVRDRWVLTPLVPALVMIETTDLIFAVDSIPAIFAITADPFLVFTSNVFAILGLRSLLRAGRRAQPSHLKHAPRGRAADGRRQMLAHAWIERMLGPNFNLHAGRRDGDSRSGVIVSIISSMARAGSSGYPSAIARPGRWVLGSVGKLWLLSFTRSWRVAYAVSVTASSPELAQGRL